jgi:peptidoglycan/LPS O-acetylase OafA/YrhL
MSAGPEVAGDVEFASRRRKWTRTVSKTLGQEFDPRNNALNAWRLVLATGVILWHSFGLTGRNVFYLPAHQLLGQIFVDGFFAVSGFLITGSWLSNPRLRNYFLARGLRILPGLWVCLIITAFVIAPIGVAIQGGSAAKLLLSTAPIVYILSNCAALTFRYDIGGTPTGIPWEHQWNGSLWTLQFELLCYIAVAIGGIAGLLRRRWPIPVVLGLALIWSALLPPLTVDLHEALTLDRLVARFAVMFLAGALLHQFRNVIPARWSLVAVSAIVVLAASLMPDYRVVGGIPLAYAIIVSGSLIRNKRLRLRTDLSYGVYIYAFPIQQLLVICGLLTLSPFVFTIISAIATLPLAALSWFLVEKPALSLKSRLKRRSVGPAGESGLAVSGIPPGAGEPSLPEET